MDGRLARQPVEPVEEIAPERAVPRDERRLRERGEIAREAARRLDHRGARRAVVAGERGQERVEIDDTGKIVAYHINDTGPNGGPNCGVRVDAATFEGAMGAYHTPSQGLVGTTNAIW